ncbi:MAG: PilZ domain-containing protein [Nitrospira sp.]|nr:PilZ domain-containing protein [Nitrospira sp.]
MADLPYQRIYLRYPMQYPLIFGWASRVGEGCLTNLSFNGCSVLCDHTPLVGAEVRVSVLLPDQRQALPIEGGRIKWAEDGQFGVEFQHLPLEARQRLNRTLRHALIQYLPTHSSRPNQIDLTAFNT